MLLEVSSKQADAEREIGLLAEIADGLRDLVVGNFEVVFLEVGDEFVAAIENGEEHVDEVDGLGDARLLLLGADLDSRRRRRARVAARGRWRRAEDEESTRESTEISDASHVDVDYR